MTDAALLTANQQAELEQSSPTSRLVAAVVAALAAEVSGELDVAEMPDKLVDYDLGERSGAVLVHYRGSKYRRGRPQPRTLTIDVHLLLRGQAGEFGSTYMVDAVALILQERQFEGSTPFQLESDGLVQEKDGLWDYVVNFTTELPRVARRQPDWRPY